MKWSRSSCIGAAAPMDDIQFPTARWGLLAVLLSLPVIIVFACFGEFSRGLTAGICTGLIIGVVRTYWIFRGCFWFWATVALLSILHVPFVIFFPIPMTRNFNQWELLPAAILDFVIMYGIIKMVAKMMNKGEGSHCSTP